MRPHRRIVSLLLVFSDIAPYACDDLYLEVPPVRPKTLRSDRSNAPPPPRLRGPSAAQPTHTTISLLANYVPLEQCILTHPTLGVALVDFKCSWHFDWLGSSSEALPVSPIYCYTSVYTAFALAHRNHWSDLHERMPSRPCFGRYIRARSSC